QPAPIGVSPSPWDYHVPLQHTVQGGLMPRTGIAGAIILTFIALVPGASAQQASGIAGLVRDTSGAVLPGVTVAAASPVLIERVRTVTTDSEGRYNIVDLRPGTHTVTFSLSGFN